eukprot:7891236-Alexandrium_andersonii.AAC.1
MRLLEHVLDPFCPGLFGGARATTQFRFPEGLVSGLLLLIAQELLDNEGAKVTATNADASLSGLLSGE